ncbi:nucleoside hydrolase [uncultured Paraglaciecola sp.]|uniref:nucleoside hydrolase n=1 Tax=uncultured Paraglaciecola sp. TaxID=1765024 RepID=UPI0030DAE8AF|tara:strand:+ start:25714 stop:26838 length:1125 start_codon:yes stop_codon:yes gene_type:complete
MVYQSSYKQILNTAFILVGLLSGVAITSGTALANKAKVIVDQDAFEGPGFQPILMIMNSPEVELLGITIVSGDGWQAEETSRTLRMLELVERTEIPVAAGATYPLINNKKMAIRRDALYGKPGYKGAWTEKWPANDHMVRADFHEADVIPDFPEGAPKLKPYSSHAAQFLIEQTRLYPGEITIISMGPLTNLALAQRLDPSFASRVKEVIMLGGYFNLDLSAEHGVFTSQVAYAPRTTFNQAWDPEAAWIVHHSPWQKLTLVSDDTSVGLFSSPEMLETIKSSKTPVANYVTRFAQPGFQLWDEVESAIFLEPDIISVTAKMYISIDINQGPNYGSIITWPEGRNPELGEQLVNVVFEVDREKVTNMFVDLLSK